MITSLYAACVCMISCLMKLMNSKGTGFGGNIHLGSGMSFDSFHLTGMGDDHDRFHESS